MTLILYRPLTKATSKPRLSFLQTTTALRTFSKVALTYMIGPKLIMLSPYTQKHAKYPTSMEPAGGFERPIC